MKKIRPSEEILIKFAQSYSEKNSSPKDIQDLYDIPKKYNDKEFKKNLVEVAHPEPAVLFQAYDKMNGLIENVNERQNIISNILDKKTEDGERTKKYATQLLTLNLIKIANDADTANISDIRILADHCISQLTNVNLSSTASKDSFMDAAKGYLSDAEDVGKGVGTGAVIGGLIGLLGGPGGALLGAQIGAGLGGALSYFGKSAPEVKNVFINAKDTKEQLADILPQFPNNKILLKLNAIVDKLIEIAPKYYTVVGDLKANAKIVDSIITSFESVLFSYKETYKQFVIAAKSGAFEDDTSSGWGKVTKPLYSFMDTDFEDVEDSLGSLNTAVDKAFESIKIAKSALGEAAIEANTKLNALQEQKSSPSSTKPAIYNEDEEDKDDNEMIEAFEQFNK